MKVLITGGAGFVGTNLIEQLKIKYPNIELFVIDNYSTGYKHNEQEGVKYYHHNIEDHTAMMEMIDIQPNIIFHLAALARIQPSFKEPRKTFDANTNGTLNVLEYARKYKTQVIYAGSSSTHGGVYKNPYTFSKWVGEELCKTYSKVYDIPTIIARFYNVYGKYMIPKESAYSTVLQIFNEQYRTNQPLTVTGDGEQRRDFTHVVDICSALIGCIEHPYLRAEFFELGCGRNYSINEVAEIYGTSKIYIPKRPGEAQDTLCESKLAKKILGWSPNENLVDYIENIKNENILYNTK
jgi:UDP-glucose 4-epimerase